MSDEVDRAVLRSSVEAEQAVLGSMMLDEGCLVRGLDELRGEAFWHGPHRLVFECLAEMAGEKERPDVVTTVVRLQQRGVLEQAGGAAYLTELTNGVPTTANFEHYCGVVADMWRLRRLASAGAKIYRSALASESRCEAIMEEAERELHAVTHAVARSEFAPMPEMLVRTLMHMERVMQHGEDAGVHCGFERLNDMLAGMHGGELLIVAARPGMGKTAFALNVALNVAGKSGRTVGVVSLEMPEEQLNLRMLSALSRVNGQALRLGRLTKVDQTKLTLGAAMLKGRDVRVLCGPELTMGEVRARCRKLRADAPGLALIVVDYLQLVDANMPRAGNREGEISYVSRSLKAMAGELGVPVMALSQLNRESERQQKGGVAARPQLSQLRESGAIEQDADVVLFLYRKDYYAKSGNAQGQCEAIVAKQRNGPTGTAMLTFTPDFSLFEDSDEQSEEG